jgi:hypothetical protein
MLIMKMAIKSKLHPQYQDGEELPDDDEHQDQHDDAETNGGPPEDQKIRVQRPG